MYAMLGRVVFGRDDDFQKHEAAGALPFLIRLQRQVSYFGNEGSVNGLMKHIGDLEFDRHLLRTLYEDRNDESIPYRLFEEWDDVEDQCFRDLILKLMNLDPGKRITAREALDHPWFEDVPLVEDSASISI